MVAIHDPNFISFYFIGYTQNKLFVNNYNQI